LAILQKASAAGRIRLKVASKISGKRRTRRPANPSASAAAVHQPSLVMVRADSNGLMVSRSIKAKLDFEFPAVPTRTTTQDADGRRQ
jgi:hypothetical protein